MTERQFEYVPPGEFPQQGQKRSRLRMVPLHKALDEVKTYEPGHGVRVPMPEGMTRHNFQRTAWNYAKQQQISIKTVFVGRWLYIQRKA